MVKDIVLGAGCFWGVQAAFNLLEGVQRTSVGYCGGHQPNPTYEEVCQKTTGHIEVVKITFSCEQLTIEDVLTVFFHIHDPTQKNGQANDIGPQYMSAIFCDEVDKNDIQNFIRQISPKFDAKIVTLVQEYKTFYPAEDYHQEYLTKNPSGYCHINMARVKEFLEFQQYRLK